MADTLKRSKPEADQLRHHFSDPDNPEWRLWQGVVFRNRIQVHVLRAGREMVWEVGEGNA